MAKAGDSYTVPLIEPHLAWGEYRHTNSRDVQYGEAYIPIRAKDAYDLSIKSSKGVNYHDTLGQNLFNCISADGYLRGILRAQGQQADDRYAKQFSMDKDLKALGRWYAHLDAKVGDRIRVTWSTDTDVMIEKL